MITLQGMTESQKQTLTQYAHDKAMVTGSTPASVAQHVLRNQPTLEVVMTYRRPPSEPGDWTAISEALAEIDGLAEQAEETAAQKQAAENQPTPDPSPAPAETKPVPNILDVIKHQ